jgi:hypothetical protein
MDIENGKEVKEYFGEDAFNKMLAKKPLKSQSPVP